MNREISVKKHFDASIINLQNVLKFTVSHAILI